MKAKTNLITVTGLGSPDFDWTVYENGYKGNSSLVANPNVKTISRKDKVYSQESYANDLYTLLAKNTALTIEAKDVIVGTMYTVVNIWRVSDHEVGISTDSGASDIIDLVKEHKFLEMIGLDSAFDFTLKIQNETYKKQLLKNGIKAKVVENGRISLAEGILDDIKNTLQKEFMEEINTGCGKYAYNAVVKEINNGGYIVDISGMRCFLPGSLAAPGIISDFSSLIGKTIPVMAINYIRNSGFVVSYKKYLNSILPSKIETELSVGMKVMAKVTGMSSNGVFLLFKDSNGEFIFNGLIHRSTMSKDFEYDFDRKRFRINDEFWAYIYSITEKDGKYRIVLSDKPIAVEKQETDNSEE